jgi:hypothetical protein
MPMDSAKETASLLTINVLLKLPERIRRCNAFGETTDQALKLASSRGELSLKLHGFLLVSHHQN